MLRIAKRSAECFPLRGISKSEISIGGPLARALSKEKIGTAYSREFDEYRSKLRAKGNLSAGIRSFRLHEHPKRQYRLAGKFARHPAYRGLLLANPFPKRFEELPRSGFPVLTGYFAELAWNASLIKAYATEISEFVALRDEVDSALLVSDDAQIEALLIRAEERFGISAWLIEHRINLHDRTGNSSGKNRYVQAILNRDNNAVFNYLLSWYSYRSGAAVSAAEFERHLDELGVPTNGIFHIICALNGRHIKVGPEAAGEMLNYSDYFPLIDRYHILISALQGLFSSGPLEDTVAEFTRSILGDLCVGVPDLQLGRLSRAFGNDVNVPLDQAILEMQDDLAANRHDKIAAAVTGARLFGMNIELLAVVLQSEAASSQMYLVPAPEERSFFGDIRSDLSTALSYGEDGIEARLRLQKIILAYCNTSWASSLRLLLERQCHDERVLEPTFLQTVLGLRSAAETIDLVLTLPAGQIRERALREAVKQNPRSPSVGFVARLCGYENSSSPSLSEMAEALLAQRQMKFERAAERLSDIAASTSSPAVALEASRLLSNTYWRDGQLAETTDLSASLFVKSKYFGSILPIRELVSELLKWHDKPLASSPTRGRLSAAIVFDAHSRYVSAEFEAERADAFKDVLRANGVRKASELGTIAHRFSISELIYFLRYICVPNVLDQSLALETSRAVEDERVSILLLISELTAGRVPAAIKEELREIRTKQIVRETTLRLDESKIYVNVEGIRRSIDVSMRDDWNRYRLMNDGLEQKLLDLLGAVRSEAGTEPMRIIFANPLSERFTLLKRMVSTLRDEFTLNKEYGLNSNLSTNIRHGYVEKEIRGPLLGRNLITNKDTDRGSYLENKFWLERPVELDISSREKLSALFSKFSAKIDDQIDRLNRQLLRIQSEETPDGLFKYALSDAALAAVDGKWASKETFDEFIETVFSTFWEGTQRNLAQVRSTLETEVISGLIESLREFAQDIASEGLDRELPGLEHALTMVQPEMRAAIERVASWFTLSSNNEYQDFDLTIAFQAGMNTVKTYFRNLTINDRYQSNGQILMNGWCLPMFARLFFLILDNAATHGARNRDRLNIAMTVEIKEGHLFIRATNDLSPDHDRGELKRKIVEINRDYGQARAMELLSEEGGSGYPKIWKLLKTDLMVRDHVLYVAANESEFSVEILLPTGGIVREASNS
ncbi:MULTISPECIES: hypothetical protein [Agrobacterium]|uniref:Uncharacterized protein n=1 Tax=Agrobacterium tumefaciens TaxID=358 RepID=A0AAE6BHG0_AGRTU|nr:MULTISPECIES: hypothetical protein [Agrobacterium]QCL76469.1 hypothetical protein CFBP5499_24010 [Agrobacterium tumefaciens]QCL81988.1 hypothetical protein CFBP5877_23265 [Agrobacterium tumefaciens]CUX67049.1 conserved hypothetical protein [Agrobacterium sp. NCPPB 925]